MEACCSLLNRDILKIAGESDYNEASKSALIYSIWGNSEYHCLMLLYEQYLVMHDAVWA